MATLTVKNVGPIREAELEVKKHTVFIGPQGTGKSTLAKLIAICSDKDVIKKDTGIHKKFNISSYISENSFTEFHLEEYKVTFNNTEIVFEPLPTGVYNYASNYSPIKSDIEKLKNLREEADEKFKTIEELIKDNKPVDKLFLQKTLDSYKNVKEKNDNLSNFLFESISNLETIYIPAERTLLAILNETVWSLIDSNVDFPKSITSFASQYQQARNTINKLNINFLDVHYAYLNSRDRLLHNKKKFVDLAQSASGYQSIIPLLLVIEHQRRESRRRFIIEEPELNLYPTAQKDLIYSLMGGLQPDVEYKDAEWVITTHSPYVLSSFNTLMLAYKVAQRSDELRAEVEKIIPARCWINPDEFAAYYVDKGTVRSIISEKTGMIADNELDDVSEDLAGEQDHLLELYRSIPSA